jgi:hypothetical protein
MIQALPSREKRRLLPADTNDLMRDKADFQSGKDVLHTDVGRVINGGNISRLELYPLFQAQVLHPVLEVHILSQIVNRLRDELRQTKLTSEDNINLY